MKPTWRRLLFLAVLVGALASGTAALAAPPRPTGSNRTQAGRTTGDPLAVPRGRWEAPAPNPPARRPAPAPPPASPRPAGTATAVAVLAAAAVAAATGKRSMAAVAPAMAPRPSTPPAKVAAKPSPAAARALQAEARAPQVSPVVTLPRPSAPPVPVVTPPRPSSPAPVVAPPRPSTPAPVVTLPRPSAPPAPPAAVHPSAATSRALQAEARDPQRGAVVTPLIPPGSKPTTEVLNSLILEAKQEYGRARAQGDTGTMEAAHRRAEWLRTQGGTYGSDQSTAAVQEQRQVGLNAGIVQAKADYAAAAARGDQAAMAVAHARAEDLRRQGGGIAAAETLDESKLHLQAGVDRQVTAEKERFAAGTPAQQDLAHRRAEELRRAAVAQGVAVIGAGTSLVEARERASAEGNRQVLLDKVAHERAHSSGDAASQALLHRDAQAQRAAGASIGQHETVSEARTHLQLHLDQGVVAQKDAFASAGGAADQEQARRRAEALRAVGRSVDVKTIGQNVSLADAQVKLVLEGGPLVAGGKHIAVQASDTEKLRQVQAGIAAGAPNMTTMRRDYQAMLARARTGDVSAIAALAVLQRQADQAHVVLNPPPTPLVPLTPGQSTGPAGARPPVHDEASRIGHISGESPSGGTLAGATSQDKETCTWVVLPIPEAGIQGQLRCSGGTPARRFPTLADITHGLGVALNWAGNLVTGADAITKEFASANGFLGYASPVVSASEDYQRYHNWRSATAKAIGEFIIAGLGAAVTAGMVLVAAPAILATGGLSALGASAGIVLTIKATSAVSDGWDGLVDALFEHKEG